MRRTGLRTWSTQAWNARVLLTGLYCVLFMAQSRCSCFLRVRQSGRWNWPALRRLTGCRHTVPAEHSASTGALILHRLSACTTRKPGWHADLRGRTMMLWLILRSIATHYFAFIQRASGRLWICRSNEHYGAAVELTHDCVQPRSTAVLIR